MANDIGIKTMLAIIDELNDIIKKSPERSRKYHIHKSKVNRILILYTPVPITRETVKEIIRVMEK
jgi:hypothetical protein